MSSLASMRSASSFAPPGQMATSLLGFSPQQMDTSTQFEEQPIVMDEDFHKSPTESTHSGDETDDIFYDAQDSTGAAMTTQTMENQADMMPRPEEIEDVSRSKLRQELESEDFETAFAAAERTIELYGHGFDEDEVGDRIIEVSATPEPQVRVPETHADNNGRTAQSYLYPNTSRTSTVPETPSPSKRKAVEEVPQSLESAAKRRVIDVASTASSPSTPRIRAGASSSASKSGGQLGSLSPLLSNNAPTSSGSDATAGAGQTGGAVTRTSFAARKSRKGRGYQPDADLMTHDQQMQVTIHTKAKEVRPFTDTQSNRYWIGVVVPAIQNGQIRKESDLIWMKGHRGTTVRTVWHMFKDQSASIDFSLMINGEFPEKEAVMEELDLYNDRQVIFRTIEQIAID